MDPHPETDLDAPRAEDDSHRQWQRTILDYRDYCSNPQEEEDRMEDQFDSGEEEDEDLEEEDPSGVNAPASHHGHESPIDFFRLSQEQQMEERKRLEREFLAQKELMIKREEQQQPPYLGGNGNSSKSTTPSPSSPPQMQYLFAANPPYAAAAAFLTPAQIAAATAAAQAAVVATAGGIHHPRALPSLGGGGGESSTGSATPPNNGSTEDQSKYTFEEQFKQAQKTPIIPRKVVRSNYGMEDGVQRLYELSDDPRRKEFLDDLFNYMQKKGSPVNRIPIMAKQVLDLYELYRLVVARGGLVEVINKKIWREITKGLNLPSSITSAAFTLRTQYMKYLYAYECDREKLSTTEELQAAIDGNRREGRRSSYGPYGDMVNPAMVPVSKNSPHPRLSSPMSLVSRQMNGHGSTPEGLSSGRGSAMPLPLAYYHNNSTSAPLPLNLAHQENGLHGSHGLSSVMNGGARVSERLEQSSGQCLNKDQVVGSSVTEDKSQLAQMIEACMRNGWTPKSQRGSELGFFNMMAEMGRIQREQLYGRNITNHRAKDQDAGDEDNCSSTPNPMVMPQQEALNLEVSRNSTNEDQKPLNMKRKIHEEEENLLAAAKRRLHSEEERLLSRSTMPSTHIKISSSRGPDGRLQTDGSLMVSMEVNGIMYQGVLHAAPNHRNRLLQ